MQRTVLLALVTAGLIGATLWLGTVLPGRQYYITATLVVLETMLPLFARFEARRPSARELALLAALAGLAAASRVAFAFVPWVKPIMGVIVVAGAAFGAEAGFLVGSIAALASNFFFGQGPWTPWQMMAYGVGGLLAGLMFHGRRACGPGVRPLAVAETPGASSRTACGGKARLFDPTVFGVPGALPSGGPTGRRCWSFAVWGFVLVLLVVGPLLDASTVFTTGSVITPGFVLAVLAAGFPANLALAVSTAVTLLLVGRPLLAKLGRLRIKYGMLE